MGRRRITGVDLAKAIGVPQSSLQRRLSGRYPFDVDELAMIATYFGVPIVTFFPDAGTEATRTTSRYSATFEEDSAALGRAA